MMIVLLVLVILALVAMAYRVLSGETVELMLSRRVAPAMCRVLGHRRRGDSIRKIGSTYHSRCRRCGVQLHKLGRDADWEVSSAPETDDEPEDDAAEVDAHEPQHRMVLLLVGGVAVGALALGVAMAPHHMAMRASPHKSFATLARG